MTTANNSTAILDRQEAANQLIVDKAIHDDNSSVSIHPHKLKMLQKLFHVDTIDIKENKRRQTACFATAEYTCQAHKIRMSKDFRTELGVGLGDVVHVFPFDDSAGDYNEHILLIRGGMKSIEESKVVGMARAEFRIVVSDTGAFSVVTSDTKTFCEGDPMKREDEEGIDKVAVRKQMAQIRELVEIPLRHHQLFKSIDFGSAGAGNNDLRN